MNLCKTIENPLLASTNRFLVSIEVALLSWGFFFFFPPVKMGKMALIDS